MKSREQFCKIGIFLCKQLEECFCFFETFSLVIPGVHVRAVNPACLLAPGGLALQAGVTHGEGLRGMLYCVSGPIQVFKAGPAREPFLGLSGPSGTSLGIAEKSSQNLGIAPSTLNPRRHGKGVTLEK